MKTLVTYVTILLASFAVWAQTPQTARPPESITEVNVSMPKAGMGQQWEQGRKRHSDFHRAQKDTWTIIVYEIQSGDYAGNYISVQPGHGWKDFDARAAFDKLDAADVQANMAPYETSGPRSFYVFRPDLSRTPEPAGTPAKMVTATHYWVVPEHVREFQDAIKTINATIDKVKYPAKPSRWYQLANGGDVPHYVLITDRAGWSDLETPAQTLEEAIGQEGAPAVAAIRRASKRIYTEALEFRPDLSYLPQHATK